MTDFVKRNLVWISIMLCTIGVILSIIGIPTQKPILFFIGIIFALPTIGYIIYQVFFDKGDAELKYQAKDNNKISPSNITTILDKKENLILMNNEDEDLEPLYNGYATTQEIENKLFEIANDERKKVIQASPATVITEMQPEENIDEDAIKNATQGALLREREIQANETFNSDDIFISDPEEEQEEKIEIIPETPVIKTKEETPVVAESPVTTAATPEPKEVPPAEPILEEVPTNDQPVTQTASPAINYYDEILRNLIFNNLETLPTKKTPDPALAELKKKKAQEKKTILAQENLEKYLQRYFIETATCFVLNRNIYKDNRGIAPYNKFSKNKQTGLAEHTMSATKGKLYKFCTYLPDMERFISHPALYQDFVNAIEKGMSLSRISENLHAVYRKQYKKDFILNLANREDWDNVIILVFNNYILNNNNFKDVFTRVPFEIPAAYNEQNVVDYLSGPDIQAKFLEKFPTFTEIGIPTVWEAIYICFINSIKNKLSMEQLETAVLKDYKKIARALKRAENTRRKLLKKAS